MIILVGGGAAKSMRGGGELLPPSAASSVSETKLINGGSSLAGLPFGGGSPRSPSPPSAPSIGGPWLLLLNSGRHHWGLIGGAGGTWTICVLGNAAVGFSSPSRFSFATLFKKSL